MQAKQAMSDIVTLSFRVPASKAKALEKLAAAQDKPKSYLLEKALDRYLDEEARFLAKVSKALADMKAGGPAVEHAAVVRWLESWGTEHELPPPKAKKRARRT
jgi:predicted transcriptional regulator